MENNEQIKIEFSYIMPMSREDISLLAVMCARCYPEIKKRDEPANLYAYYIPVKEEYLLIAQNVFNKNGIKPQIHTSKINNPEGQEVLRINYRFCNSHSKLVNIMESINKRSNMLWSPILLMERNAILEKIDNMKKQIQK